MKIRYLSLIAIVLALCFILIGCGDKFKGEYKEITSEQKTEYSEKVSNVKKEVEKKNIETSLNCTINSGKGGRKVKSSIEGTTLIDKSDENNFLYFGEFNLFNKNKSRFCKLELYYTDNDKIYVEFRYNSSFEDDEPRYYSVEGFIEKDTLDSLMIMHGYPSLIKYPYVFEYFMGKILDGNEMLETFSEAITSKNDNLFVDDDKIKMVDVNSSAKMFGEEKFIKYFRGETTDCSIKMRGEMYLNANVDEFGIKASMKSIDEDGNYDNKSETIIEITTTNKTAKIPSFSDNINLISLERIESCIMFVLMYPLD